MTASAPIPFTVIGGFLGAGKTTLLNRLLSGSTERCAVLVNDFGEINVDAALIRSHDGTTMSLTNGCVCCSIGAGFLDTLARLLDDVGRFDRVVIEASGVGDPWRIAEIALVEPSLRLDGVVVLADAARIAAQSEDRHIGDTIRNQFAKCDVVLLSKCDLVTEIQREAACAVIRAIRPDVSIEPLSAATPAETVVFGRGRTARFRAEPVAETIDHESDFRRWTYRRDGRFDRDRLAIAVRALPQQLLRLKGTCMIDGDARAQVFQLVSRDWSLTPAEQDTTAAAERIALAGVGTVDLISDHELDAILDRALTAA
ncbi:MULTISPECIES: GTP-binding protein [unclassified Bradyrhizobium]|uniref:CobW family GTP-binding protein n=1 Tax=unclassified Bradyrhizobium TaxID=2631580 RepID=UPI0028ED76C2|nr:MULTISPECIES: GTP-binding protein [unclassified Bradyrhizobium]